jgi:hypothetical protein
MARGTLHAPKPDDQRRRRNKPAHGENVVRDDGVLRGPDLLEETGREWSVATTRWYTTWRRSPQAQLFEATDWERLLTLVPLVEYYHSGPKPSAAALSEIRLNEERLGATIVDRMRARIVIEHDDPDGADADVVQLRSVSSRADVMARMKGEK